MSKADLRKTRRELNNKILDREDKLALSQELEKLDLEERMGQAQRDALGLRCVAAEGQLH